MFDIGFLELIVVAVVALLVIGPEQLPGTLRTAGLWIGRFKRGLQNTRHELEQQLGADDIRRQLHNEEVMQRLNASKAEMEQLLYRETNLLASNNTPTTTGTDKAADHTGEAPTSNASAVSNATQNTTANDTKPH